MQLIRKGHRHAHRGVIGIEAAIVLIAFVIVAAALAFVVLNMGFTSTQKAKTAIVAALNEAGSALQVSGKITATGAVQDQRINTTNIPIKIVSGGASSNLDGNVTAIKFLSNTREFDNIYDNGPIYLGDFRNSTLAWNQAVTNGWITAAQHPITGQVGPPQTIAIVYWINNINNNTIIDIGEHAVISVGYSNGDRPKQLDVVAVEVSVPQGAPLTVDRTIPNISSTIIDMG